MQLKKRPLLYVSGGHTTSTPLSTFSRKRHLLNWTLLARVARFSAYNIKNNSDTSLHGVHRSAKVWKPSGVDPNSQTGYKIQNKTDMKTPEKLRNGRSGCRSGQHLDVWVKIHNTAVHDAAGSHKDTIAFFSPVNLGSRSSILPCVAEVCLRCVAEPVGCWLMKVWHSGTLTGHRDPRRALTGSWRQARQCQGGDKGRQTIWSGETDKVPGLYSGTCTCTPTHHIERHGQTPGDFTSMHHQWLYNALSKV